VERGVGGVLFAESIEGFVLERDGERYYEQIAGGNETKKLPMALAAKEARMVFFNRGNDKYFRRPTTNLPAELWVLRKVD
jgi:hypothetical protein